MPSLKISVPHALPVPDAVERLKGLTARLRTKYGGKVDDIDEWWARDRGEFTLVLSGTKVKGSADVSTEDVRVSVEVPLIAMAFKSMIESSIRTEVKACLA